MGTAIGTGATVAPPTPTFEPAPLPGRSAARRGRFVLLPYVLITPATLVIVGVLAFPLGMLAWLSFQHYGLRELIAHQGEWVGLGNYRTIFADPTFQHVVVVSLVFTVANVGLTIGISTLIALLLQRVSSWVRVLLGSGLVFVWATPVIVAIDVWQWMFDYEFGVVNYALTKLGAGDFIHHNWFEDPLQGFTVITVVVVWGAIPFVTITLFAALTQVPSDLVEAAQVDGANAWAIFWQVTAPLLRPIFLIVTCLSTIWDFQVFNQVYVLLNQRPTASYFTIAVYSYRESFGVTQYGLGASIAVVMVLVLVAVTFFYVRQTLKAAELGS